MNQAQRKSKTSSGILAVLSIYILLSTYSSVSFATPSAFAVFRVSYSTSSGDVRGGVAGTAFFTSTQKAQSAYHVLNESSFQPNAGHDQVQVWLVQEGHPAIEVRAQEIKTRADRDLVLIHFSSKVIASEKVFPVLKDRASSLQINSALSQIRVETEGFRAGSTGPVLYWDGPRLRIDSVPRLEKIRLSGEVLRQGKVTLGSADVNLVEAPAFQTSYPAIVGTSGGPILSQGKVIGFNSFSDPTSRTAWGISVER